MLPLVPPSIVSHLRARVQGAQVSVVPEPNLLLAGVVTSTPVPSPFGEQIGCAGNVEGRPRRRCGCLVHGFRESVRRSAPTIARLSVP